MTVYASIFEHAPVEGKHSNNSTMARQRDAVQARNAEGLSERDVAVERHGLQGVRGVQAVPGQLPHPRPQPRDARQQPWATLSFWLDSNSSKITV